MISPVTDMHTHSVACDHAYSTVLENLQYAKKHGLRGIAVTEHCPTIADAPCASHFRYSQLPRTVEGVMIFKGAEVNVLDTQGHVDLDEELLRRLDWVIASMHGPCFAPDQPPEAVSEAWIRIAENPLIDCIGHSGAQCYAFDYERVIPVFAEYGKVVEINNHSFRGRQGSKENCTRIAALCKKYRVPVVLSSDAHFALNVGVFDQALEVLRTVDFPEELVLNNDLNRLIDFINRKPHKNKIERSE